VEGRSEKEGMRGLGTECAFVEEVAEDAKRENRYCEDVAA
jgi:hypothetical protein